jgi:hypothetical protein
MLNKLAVAATCRAARGVRYEWALGTAGSRSCLSFSCSGISGGVISCALALLMVGSPCCLALGPYELASALWSMLAGNLGIVVIVVCAANWIFGGGWP